MNWTIGSRPLGEVAAKRRVRVASLCKSRDPHLLFRLRPIGLALRALSLISAHSKIVLSVFSQRVAPLCLSMIVCAVIGERRMKRLWTGILLLVLTICVGTRYEARQTKVLGSERLVSVEPLPPMDGVMCENLGSDSPQLMASLQAERLPQTRAVAAAPAPGNDRPGVTLNRQPVRTIHDPYATYSAVFVDPIRDEIVLQDENLFQIMTYDRTANTPPKAALTEPKRIIGGSNTKIEFNCGLYVDPKSGDIYSVSNDTVDTMVVFSRNQKGNVPPARELFTPHRTFGIAVNEESQELILTVQSPPAIMVYRKL